MMKKIIPSFAFLLTVALGLAQTAHVQIIHNSPDISIPEVDIYVNNQMVVDSLYFRTATSYIAAPAGTPFVVSVMPPSVTDTARALYHQTFNLMPDSSYVVIASGLVNPALYDSIKPFKLAAMKTHRRARQNGNIDILVYHGAPEEPPVRVNETTVPVPALIDSLPYDNFAPYLPLATADYQLEVENTFTSSIVAEYSAPLNTLNLMDSSIVVVASGFVDTLKSITSDSTLERVPKFGLFAALPIGGALIPLPVISGISIDEMEHAPVSIFPNPADDHVIIAAAKDAEITEVEMYDLSGSLIKTFQLNQSDDQYFLETSKIESGLYILQMNTGNNNQINQRLILR